MLSCNNKTVLQNFKFKPFYILQSSQISNKKTEFRECIQVLFTLTFQIVPPVYNNCCKQHMRYIEISITHIHFIRVRDAILEMSSRHKYATIHISYLR